MIDAIKNSMPLLFEESMPVWMTLVIGLIAAVGSYFLAPAINRKLEIDKQRSQHVANAIIIFRDKEVRFFPLRREKK